MPSYRQLIKKQEGCVQKVRKLYEKPCLDVVEFEKEDIMTGGGSAPEEGTIFEITNGVEDLGEF